MSIADTIANATIDRPVVENQKLDVRVAELRRNLDAARMECARLRDLIERELHFSSLPTDGKGCQCEWCKDARAVLAARPKGEKR